MSLRSACRPRRCDRSDQLLGPVAGDGGGVGEGNGTTSVQKLTEPLSVGERLVCTSRPERVGPEYDCHRFTVTRDGHFVAFEHAVEDLGQCRSRLTYRHGGHGPSVQIRTQLYTSPIPGHL